MSQDFAVLKWISFSAGFRGRDAEGNWIRAAGDEGGWLLTDNPEAAGLKALLLGAGNRETVLKMGGVDFDVRLSPGQGMFIQRSPVSKREYGRAKYGYAEAP
jgi:hypothetical protein